jgi:aspartate/methionine/tyrosine aminotransferase
METGANHLNDISLRPEFSGICGFTLKEFDSLFADRMEDTLIELIKSEEISDTSGTNALRAKILDWYNGYKWGGIPRL